MYTTYGYGNGLGSMGISESAGVWTIVAFVLAIIWYDFQP